MAVFHMVVFHMTLFHVTVFHLTVFHMGLIAEPKTGLLAARQQSVLSRLGCRNCK